MQYRDLEDQEELSLSSIDSLEEKECVIDDAYLMCFICKKRKLELNMFKDSLFEMKKVSKLKTSQLQEWTKYRFA